MANEKILNTRIRLKYDSLQNWTEKNTVLLQGEVAIAYLATSHTETTPDNGTHPVLMKVGPGAFNSLPWMSALAADVYAWAKATEAEHIEWLKTNHADNNTTYAFAIVDGALQVTETPHVNGVAGTPVVKSYDFITPDELTTILNNYYTKTEVNAITGDLANLNTTNKGNLVAAINEALQAVEVGGTGSVVTVADSSFESNDSDKTYTGSIRFDVKQGGNKVSVPIEFGAGTGLEVTQVGHPSGETVNIPAIGLSDETKASLAKADTALQEHQDISGKADKVTGATAGNFAGLDANGNLTDSGKKAADFAPADIDTGVHSVALASGTDNGTLKLTVDGVETDKIAVTGLKSAAYETVENLNATAKEYADAVEDKLPTKADKSVVDAMYTNSKIDELLATKQNTIPANTYDAYGAAADVLGKAGDKADDNTVYGAKAAAAAAQSDATIAKTKIEAFLGAITPEGTSEAIDTLAEIQKYMTDDTEAFAQLSTKVTNIENGTTATTAGDLTAALEAEIKGYTVANATKAADADKLGGQAPSHYATAASVTDITKDNGTIDTKIKAVTDTFGDIVSHDASEFATAAQGTKADTAHEWGDHSKAGYAKDADLTKVINGTTPVAKATDADTLGGQAPSHYATAASVTAIAENGGTIDTKIAAYNTSKNFGDIITRNAAEFATSGQGENADTAYNWGNHANAGYAKSADITDSLAKADSAVQSVGFSEQDGSVVLAVNAQDYSFSEIEGVDGVAVGLGVGANSGGKSLEIKIADAGVTTAKIADHAISAHHMKACADYNGEDAEVWVFNCGGAE